MANSADAPKIYTLEELVARTGPATEEEVFLLIEGYDRNELIDWGADVATSRIDTDTARDYGRALDYWQTASKEQKRALLGMSDKLLRIAIWAARHGQLLAQAHARGQSGSAAAQSERRVGATQIRKQAKARRNQLKALLLTVVAGDAELRSRVDHAYGTASTPATLGKSLQDLAALGQELLASDQPGIKARREGVLEAEILTETTAMATDAMRKGEEAESAQQVTEVTQGTVDLWDGINLAIYERILDIFDAGREADATIIRLSPVATRRVLGRQRRKPKSETEPPTPSTPPGKPAAPAASKPPAEAKAEAKGS
ncbi:MAG TPA: hypothetical protein VH877_13470 [Polyangia bacterium]|jgi:hypothetical protein|nr:hypothetical protein [Polyangia bacterium]